MERVFRSLKSEWMPSMRFWKSRHEQVSGSVLAECGSKVFPSTTSKRVHRVYCQMGLNLRRRTKRVLPKRIAQPLEVLDHANHQWALDFMHDTLYYGKRFRTLNVVDEDTRDCLAIEVDTSLSAGRVVRV